MLALLGLAGVCLGLCVISIPLLSLSPEREPGEKQQPGHSQSRQIVGVPGMQCKDTEWECDPVKTHAHARLLGILCANMSYCHFTLEDENVQKKLQFHNGIEIRL